MGKKLTNAVFIERASNLHSNKFNYSKTVYKNNRSYITIICPTHGEFKQLAKSHLIGAGCLQCENQKRVLSENEFICRAINKHGMRYNYIKINYTGAHSIVTINCNIHGDFKQRASAHLEGHGCPLCNCSFGEKEIEKYLMQNNFKFTREHSFNDLKGNYDFLRFDFVVYNNDSTIKCLIEYDGIQHFKYVKTLHKSKDGFLLQKHYDVLKNDYCKLNKFNLIRISYREKYKINEILSTLI